MTSDKKPPGKSMSGKDKEAVRKARSAAALRANLKRRKAQLHARAEPEREATEPGHNDATPDDKDA